MEGNNNNKKEWILNSIGKKQEEKQKKQETKKNLIEKEANGKESKGQRTEAQMEIICNYRGDKQHILWTQRNNREQRPQDREAAAAMQTQVMVEVVEACILGKGIQIPTHFGSLWEVLYF